MQYVMVIDIPEEELEGDESIENAARYVQVALDVGAEGTVPPQVRPLSEIIAC